MINNNFRDTYGLENKMNKTSINLDSDGMKTNHQTDNLKVVIRIRPALPREMEQDLPFRSIVHITITRKFFNKNLLIH